MLDSRHEVVRCLLTYADWWQPLGGSVISVGRARKTQLGDGLSPGLIETLDERTELARRVATLEETSRRTLYMFYVTHKHVDDIAEALDISKRQCFRRRSAAIKAIVAMSDDANAA